MNRLTIALSIVIVCLVVAVAYLLGRSTSSPSEGTNGTSTRTSLRTSSTGPATFVGRWVTDAPSGSQEIPGYQFNADGTGFSFHLDAARQLVQDGRITWSWSNGNLTISDVDQRFADLPPTKSNFTARLSPDGKSFMLGFSQGDNNPLLSSLPEKQWRRLDN